jgi:MoaA/NifB/PqqE/SkfB family radical SAM enzyme
MKEDKGITSYRERSNIEHNAIFKNKYERNLNLLGKDDLDFPEDIQMNITNLCNLKCQMCSGENSSKLLVENNALGYENLNQKDYDLTDSNYQKMLELVKHDLKILKILGGEPFFNPRVIKLLEMLVQNGQAENIKLHVTTNGTMCDDKIISLLKEFKDLRLVFSVDGYGKCNEYMRFPSSWDVVSKNIKRFKTLQNAYVYINCVVQNLNVLYVDQLLKFANQNDIFIKLDLVLNPNWLHLSVLPKSILTMAHSKLSSIKKEDLHHTDSVDQIVNMLETNINNYNLDTVKYNNFIDMVKKRDNYRKIDIKNYLPELADEILK